MTATATVFSPARAAREILDTTDLTDLDDIAEKIYAATPPDEIPHAYRALLREVAREAIRLGRMREPEADAECPEGTPLEDCLPAARRFPQPSSRVRGIRAQHEAWLRQRVNVENGWKMLGDCTVREVLFIAAQRRDAATRNAAVAAEFEDLAERMRLAGVEYVRDLDVTS